MSAAVYDTVTAKIMAGKYEFRASGSQLKFDGFMKLYTEGKDGEEQEEGSLLPELAEGEVLTLKKLVPEQHFTQPPPPYSEAMLVRTLEEKGIGRPSTYAPIIETLQARGYVVRENKVFHATELGRVVLEQLLEFFPEILDVDFTAQMELELDRIAAGELDWVEVIRRFYEDFAVSLRAAEEKMEKVVIAPEESDETCPKCGRRLVYKMGRYGKFLACPGFPECRYAKPIVKTLAVDCPECGSPLVERRTKRRRIFYGCSGYPACNFTTWDVPQKEKCPHCGYLTVLKGKTLQCANSKCGAVIREATEKSIRQGKKAGVDGKKKMTAGRRGSGA